MWLERDIAMFAQGWTIEILMLFYRVWHVAPFTFVVFYAGLQTVNMDILESAIIDGASRWERLRYVIVPHLMPLIVFVSLIHLMDAYRVFEEIVGFSSQAHRISLQWLTYDFLRPDDTGNRAVSRASASAMLTMIGIVIILIPLPPAHLARPPGVPVREHPHGAAPAVFPAPDLGRVPRLLVPARLLSAVLDHGDELQGAGGRLRLESARGHLRSGDPRQRQGLSILDILAGLALLWLTVRLAVRKLPAAVERHSPRGWIPLGWLAGSLLFGLAFIIVFFVIAPPILGGGEFHRRTLRCADPRTHDGALPSGLGGECVLPELRQLPDRHHRRGHDFPDRRHPGRVRPRTLGLEPRVLAPDHRTGVPCPAALVLVAGYLPVFVNSAEILSPILGEAAPTLYGKPYAVIAVLVSINQPFTIWMLRSFFQNIPADLDEAARVDGCTHFQAFRWVIMPVMWPGVITTGLFSFLLAYNDSW